ncbi:hypothetical protein ATO11_12120 [Pseudaestuariivita atlantica]|uniref:Lipoprotein n=1 Tax=Pseudaestuariivita atlantica TaxID=1317121 RepID=A0A0L1JN61_9RHOB|nr:hypothetical protein ATO11_12120 [Pseudaestuariivita atlantica]
MFRTRALVIAVVGLTACSTTQSRHVTRAEALELMNTGKVTEIGVTHSGETILTLRDGSFVSNHVDVIGYPRQLLAECAACEDVTHWIE